MSDAFIPFAPQLARSKSADASFRVLVKPQSSKTAPPPPASSAVRLAGTSDLPDPAGPYRPDCTSAGEPEVTLDREGDRITRITIRCGCGQVMELNCSY